MTVPRGLASTPSMGLFTRSSSHMTAAPPFQFKFEAGGSPSSPDRFGSARSVGPSPPVNEVHAPAVVVSHRAAEGRDACIKRLQEPECGVYQEPIGCSLQLDDCASACRRRVQEIAAEQRRMGQKYTDPAFPPEIHSLFASGRPPPTAPPDAPWPASWQRASEGAFSSASSRRSMDPAFGNPRQGAGENFHLGPLGCASLLGALAALRAAGRPAQELIVWREPEAGVYGVRFFKDGEWMYDILDDFFPLDGTGAPACSYAVSGGDAQDWLALVEKGYAKVHGSYEAAAASSEAEALEDVLGMGASRVDMSEFPIWGELWQHLKSKHARGYVQIAVRRRERLGELLTSGLVSRYVYPLTRLELVDGEMLCELGNPWPHGEWHGRWGESSQERARGPRQLEPLPGSCRPFWMTIQDFCKNFTDIFEARVVSPYWQSCSVVCTSARPSYPLVSVAASTQAIFVLSQGDRRWSGQDDYHGALGLKVYRSRIVAPSKDAVGVRQNVSSPFKNLELLVARPPVRARSVVAEVARLEPNSLYIVAIESEYQCPFATLRILSASAPRFRELSAPEASYFLQAQASAPTATDGGSFSSQGSAERDGSVPPLHGAYGAAYGGASGVAPPRGLPGGLLDQPGADYDGVGRRQEWDHTKLPRFVQACIATCGGPLNC